MAFSDPEFEAAIAQLEADFAALKIRYQEVQDAQTRITELQDRQAEITAQPEALIKQDSLKTELNLIVAEIERLELKLESNLLKWQEPFWQVVRFTGVGILIGWVLNSIVF